MRLLGEWTYGHAEGICVYGSTLYVTIGDTLRSYNISSLSSPVLNFEVKGMGIVLYGGTSTDKTIAANDKLVAVTQFGDGVAILDLQSMTATRIVLDTEVMGLTIQGNLLYVAAYNKLVVYDVSTPLSPVEVARKTMGAVGVSANQDVVAVIGSGYSVVTVLNRLSLATISSNTFTGNNLNGVVFKEGSTIMVIGSRLGQFYVIDYSSGSVISTYNCGIATGGHVALYGNMVYVGWHDYRTEFVDISDLAAPKLMSYLTVFGYCRGVISLGNNYWAYSGHYRGVFIIDGRVPSVIANTPAYGRTMAAILSNDNRYVFSIDDIGLRVIDFSNPLNPVEVKYISFASRGWHSLEIDRTKNLLYCPFTWGGLRIIDVSNPVSPVIVLDYNPPEYIDAVKRGDNKLYVDWGLSNKNLKIFDVSNPASIVAIGEFVLGVRAINSIEVIGNVCYVGGDTNLYVLDVSNPASIVQLNKIAMISSADQIRATQFPPRLYITLRYGQFLIYDIADPANPVLLKTFKPYSASADALAIEGNYAYVGFSDVLSKIDISNPLSPVIVEEDVKANKRDVFTAYINNGLMATAHGGEGVKVFSLDLPPPENGTLEVTTSPVAGQILVNGSPVGTGHVSLELSAGNYTVTFGEVAGYTSPSAKNVVILENQTTSIVGEYLIASVTGTLHVTTSALGESVAGQIYVNGVSQGVGDVTLSLAPGDYTVGFGGVAGYTKPDDVIATVVANETKNVVGMYVLEVPVPPEPLNVKAIVLGFVVTAAALIVMRRR